MAEFDRSDLLPGWPGLSPFKRRLPSYVEIFSLAADLSPLSSLFPVYTFRKNLFPRRLFGVDGQAL